MPRKPLVHTGQTYGLLTVVEQARSDVRGNRRWYCTCTCGNPRARFDEAQLHHGYTGVKTCGHCHKFMRACLDSLTLALTAPPSAPTPRRARTDLERFAPKPGAIFGCLIVTGQGLVARNDGDYYIECACNCGNSHIMVKAAPLMRGRVKSCGCLNSTGKSSAVPTRSP